MKYDKIRDRVAKATNKRNLFNVGPIGSKLTFVSLYTYTVFEVFVTFVD